MKGTKIHMTAICGMGMGSLAGYLKESGARIEGSDDNVYPPMSDLLKAIGVEIKKGYRESNISKDTDIIIIGNAVTKDNPESLRAKESRIPYFSMPGFLERHILPDKRPLVVAGTHGKTTTTSLLGWVLESAGCDPSVIVGGIVKSWEKSYRVGNGEHFVIEGDEYDSAYFDKVPKFLHYMPYSVILTGIEFDHSDIYSNLDLIKTEFVKLADLVRPEGAMVVYGDDANAVETATKSRSRTVKYGFSRTNEYRADNLKSENGRYVFDVLCGSKKAARVNSPLIGRQNVMNALAVFSLLHDSGMAQKTIIEGIESFPGVKRRQELIAEIRGIKIIDDFAHHPTAINLTVEGYRFAYPGSRIWAVFEPRTNTSRRKYFEKQFPKSFQNADITIIAQVYNAQALKEEERLDVQGVVDCINSEGKKAFYLPSVDEIVNMIVNDADPGDIVILMSNGGFGGIYEKLIGALHGR